MLKSEVQKLLGSQAEESSHSPQGNLDASDLRPGDIVQSLVLKKEFTVQSVDLRKQEALIAKGPIKINVPVSTLTRSKHGPAPAKVSVHFEKKRNAQLELDVRGMRLSECQSLVEQSLGDLLAGDVPYLSVIHGHGDGVLKNWLRDYLKRSKDFQAEVSETGNDGETRITLR